MSEVDIENSKSRESSAPVWTSPMMKNTEDRGAVPVTLNNFSIRLADTKPKPNETKSSNKALLYPVSTTIAGGSLFAILGGSGSGKTTLLNVIAGRYDKKAYKIGGELLFDHVLAENTTCGVGYVTQSDYLLPFLTVHETILFAAKLRISQLDVIRRVAFLHKEHTTRSEIHAGYEQIVNEVILGE